MRIETYIKPYNNPDSNMKKVDAVFAGVESKSDSLKKDTNPNQKDKTDDLYSSSVKIDLEKTGEALKDEKAKLKIMTTCMKISKRMMQGDSVPVADKDYLRKNDPSLYARSIIKRFPKAKPFKYRRVSPYEKEEFDTSNPIAEGLKELAESSTGDIQTQVQEVSAAVTETTKSIQ